MRERAMAKIRVFELAEMLKVKHKDLLNILNDMGYNIKSHMSSLYTEEAEKIKETLLEDARLIAAQNEPRTIKMFAVTAPKAHALPQEDLKFEVIDNAPKEIYKPHDHKRIKIKAGETGHTYENLFGEYLRNAKTVRIQDKHIKTNYQIKYLITFCRMLKKMGTVKDIQLITGPSTDENNVKKRKTAFDDLKKDLKEHGISFSFEFNGIIHDREITTDDGWVIDIGLGLSIYQFPNSSHSLDIEDYERRKCRETTINITQIKE